MNLGFLRHEKNLIKNSIAKNKLHEIEITIFMNMIILLLVSMNSFVTINNNNYKYAKQRNVGESLYKYSGFQVFLQGP